MVEIFGGGGADPFISATAALPLSIAVVRSLRLMALTIAFTWGIALLRSAPSGIRAGHLSKLLVL